MIDPLPHPLSAADVDRWARACADALLRRTSLICDGIPHRLLEIELYVSAARYDDPFAHAHPMQRTSGGWYFHRAGQSYRGGTFKGLDLTQGRDDAAVGWLLRSIEAPGGHVVDGSCMVVDHLLATAGVPRIGPLDTASPRAWDPDSRLHLAAASPIEATIISTPRVGLTLKRADQHPTMPAHIARRLRFLTAPRRVRKGRLQTIAALVARGDDAAAIRRQTGSPRATIERAIEAWQAGRGETPDGFVGERLTSATLYRLYGACDARWPVTADHAPQKQRPG